MISLILCQSENTNARVVLNKPEYLVNLYTSSFIIDDQFPDDVINTSIDNEVHAIV
jgi:hypothetical protein